MGIRFNADEIFEIAEKIEQNGVAFYGAAAERVADESAKEFLGKLSEWEKTHVEIFAAMRRELSGKALAETTYDPDNQAALYLQAMVYGRVFGLDPSAVLGGKESDEDILKIAIDLEKDSVIFYQSMKEVVPGTGGKEKIDAIITEEIGHIVILRNQLYVLKE